MSMDILRATKLKYGAGGRSAQFKFRRKKIILFLDR